MDKVTHLGILIDRVTELLGRFERDALSRGSLQELSYSEIQTLKAAAELGEGKINEIADRVGLARPSMTAVIDKMEEKGLLHRKRSLEDRRAVHIILTEKGAKLNEEHLRIHHIMAEQILKTLEESEQEALIKGLEKIIGIG